MESWRRELYQRLQHSVEGSTWQDHKYIAIVDGRYIYPEDVKNGSSSSAASTSSTSTSTSSSSSSTTSTRKPKKVKKQKDSEGKSIDVTDKGSVKNARELPSDAAIGDMYYIEDTKTYAYWNGKQWTPIDESQAAAAGVGGVGGGGSGKKEDDSVEGISQSTLDRAREAVKKLNSGGSGSSGSTAKKKQIDSHQKSWDQRKAAGKVSSSSSVSSAKNSKSASIGKKVIGSTLKSLVSKAVSSLKASSINAGSKVVSRTRGAQR